MKRGSRLKRKLTISKWKLTDLIIDVQKFNEKYSEDLTEPELFIKNEHATYLKQEFNKEISFMPIRPKKPREKRRLFVAWYVLKFQNEKTMKTMINELADMCFVNPRTIEIDLYSETSV